MSSHNAEFCVFPTLDFVTLLAAIMTSSGAL